MFTVRAALEGLAASIVATRPDRAGAGRLRAAGLPQPAAIGDMVDADLAFHRLLCEITGNATLVRAWGTLTGPIRVAILFAGPGGVGQHVRRPPSAPHRRDRQRRPGAARSAVDAHMRDAARTLLAHGRV